MNGSYYYGFTFLALIITLGAQLFVSLAYGHYSKVPNKAGIPGMQVARDILYKNDLSEVAVSPAAGRLNDHYDPTYRHIILSERNYNGSSVAAAAIAAHECGHALQDQEAYVLLRFRSALVPYARFSSYGGYLAILVGIFFGWPQFIGLGILFEAVILLFHLLTLPVEIDASRRAMEQLLVLRCFDDKELAQARTVLIAAALTYVASLAASLLQILRLSAMHSSRRK